MAFIMTARRCQFGGIIHFAALEKEFSGLLGFRVIKCRSYEKAMVSI